MALKITSFKKKKAPAKPSKINLPKRGDESPPEPTLVTATEQREEKVEEKPKLTRTEVLKIHAFKPGQSGNPSGRPKDQLRIDLEEYVETEMEMIEKGSGQKIKLTKSQLLARAMVNKAIGGDVRAAELVYDRILGKPKINLPGGNDDPARRIIFLPVREGPQGLETYQEEQKPQNHEQ